MSGRLELNKRALDPNLEGKVSLFGLSRFPYMRKGFGKEGYPELVFVYDKMPEKYENGLRELVEEPSCQEVESLPGERRYRFPNFDVIITDIEADNELLKKEQAFLDENEVFCFYLDEERFSDYVSIQLGRICGRGYMSRELQIQKDITVGQIAEFLKADLYLSIKYKEFEVGKAANPDMNMQEVANQGKVIDIRSLEESDIFDLIKDQKIRIIDDTTFKVYGTTGHT